MVGGLSVQRFVLLSAAVCCRVTRVSNPCELYRFTETANCAHLTTGPYARVGNPCYTETRPRMKITEDLVLGAKFRYTRQGGLLVRVFDVSGLTPGKDTLAQAATATDGTSRTRIPRYGDTHPAVYGLYVIGLEAEPIQNSRTTARVSVTYGSPELGPVPNAVQITITGSTARN